MPNLKIIARARTRAEQFGYLLERDGSQTIVLKDDTSGSWAVGDEQGQRCPVTHGTNQRATKRRVMMEALRLGAPAPHVRVLLIPVKLASLQDTK